MSSLTQSSDSLEQVNAWLRGLLTIAWADGHFDLQEQQLIEQLVRDDLALSSLQPITSEQLSLVLGNDPQIGSNFMRTAVMVAIADGIYSTAEDQLLQQFSSALGTKTQALEALRLTLDGHDEFMIASDKKNQPASTKDLLHPVRLWLDETEIHNPQIARFLCKMIPAQCPFERDVTLFGHQVMHIPPLCKLNPLYEQLVGLRFRALSYLADDCGEDISGYVSAQSSLN